VDSILPFVPLDIGNVFLFSYRGVLLWLFHFWTVWLSSCLSPWLILPYSNWCLPT